MEVGILAAAFMGGVIESTGGREAAVIGGGAREAADLGRKGVGIAGGGGGTEPIIGGGGTIPEAGVG